MAKFQLIPRTRFGKWTVISESDPGKHGDLVCLCECDCGTRRTVRVSHLRRGTSKSCGCSWTIPKVKNIEGIRFGGLITLRRHGTDKQGNATWLCKCDCGGEKIVSGARLKDGNVKSCGCLNHRKGPESSCWKGGYKAKSGYLYTSADGKCVLLHRIIMEKHLGRKLTQDESVHHINGNKADNKIENLELWTGKHSSGQRVEQITQFCLQHLELYAPQYLVSPREERKCRSAI